MMALRSSLSKVLHMHRARHTYGTLFPAIMCNHMHAVPCNHVQSCAHSNARASRKRRNSARRSCSSVHRDASRGWKSASRARDERGGIGRGI